MTRSEAAIFGVRPEAMPAWLSLSRTLEQMTDEGRQPVCVQNPEQWTSDALPEARAEAVEACGYCPAQSTCRAFAIANKEQAGVWGGDDYTPLPRGRRDAA